MAVKVNNSLNKVAEILGYQNGLVRMQTDAYQATTPFKKYLADDIFKKADIDAIYFTGDQPFIHFKTLSSFNSEVVKEIHKDVWNLGRAPLLFLITPQEVRIYNCYATPVIEELGLDSILLDSINPNEVNGIKRLQAHYHQSIIDSGKFWATAIGKKINEKNKVDQKLLSNLRAARKKLHEDYRIDLPIVHDLLGRALFMLYLQDRAILTESYYSNLLPGAKNFFDILENTSAVYNLFDSLREKFNGDIFPVSSLERLLISQAHLSIISNCFYGIDLITQQIPILRIFDFNLIPIELISAIYEEFLHTQEEDLTIKKQGAFYTPHTLVEFILNEVLPWPDDANQSYNLKILDPACGSGIFLVEAYRRLIERWKYSHRQAKIPYENLRDILTDSIYGIEKNGEAIKVAAFSLYLALLNYLEPKEIWLNVQFPNLVARNEAIYNHGLNLYECSTFSTGAFGTTTYDLVIGNPPWKFGGLDAEIAAYIERHRLPKEMVVAFIHYISTSLAPQAKIALVCAAKIFFNTDTPYEKFRREFLFEKTTIDAIVNFAPVRESLFEKTKTASCVIFFQNKKYKPQLKDNILYCIPKQNERLKRARTIVIDATEIKFIPIDELKKKDSKVLKVAMFGSIQDLYFINRLKYETLNHKLPKNERGIGLHIKEGHRKNGNPELINHKFIPPEQLDFYYNPVETFSELGEQHKHYRTNTSDIFNPPLVLIKEGLKDKKFCSSYIDYKCAYKKSILGISLKDKTPAFHKALTAYLSSSFVSYYLFLTNSSWGIDRGRVITRDILSLPALPFYMSDDIISSLSIIIDKIIEKKKKFLYDDDYIISLQQEIDEIIFQELHLSDSERQSIYDILTYSINVTEGSLLAYSPVVVEQLIKYCETLNTEIRKVLDFSLSSSWTTVYPPSGLMCGVSIHFNDENEAGKIQIGKLDNFKTILNLANKITYEQRSQSIYYRKVFKYYDKENFTIYLVKPNERRLWSKSMATNDSSDILIDLISAQ